MAEKLSGSQEKTPILGIPFLTSEQKTALHEQEDHGITPASQIRDFKDFDEWIERGGAANNFWGFFSDDLITGARREMECAQRFRELYPELDAELVSVVTQPGGLQENPSAHFEQETEEKFLDAYNKLAALVDVQDAFISNGRSDGQVDPVVLLR